MSLKKSLLRMVKSGKVKDESNIFEKIELRLKVFITESLVVYFFQPLIDNLCKHDDVSKDMQREFKDDSRSGKRVVTKNCKTEKPILLAEEKAFVKRLGKTNVAPWLFDK